MLIIYFQIVVIVLYYCCTISKSMINNLVIIITIELACEQICDIAVQLKKRIVVNACMHS